MRSHLPLILIFVTGCAFIGEDTSKDFFQEELSKVTSEYLITSRIDNDDCIAYNFIADVQKRFVETLIHHLTATLSAWTLVS